MFIFNPEECTPSWKKNVNDVALQNFSKKVGIVCVSDLLRF